MTRPFDVVADFELAVADYTGSKYCVAVNSCSMAILLAVAWHLRRTNSAMLEESMDAAKLDIDYPGKVTQRPAIEIPNKTYVSVPMAIIHAGGRPTFRDEEWMGAYQLRPLPVWDSARWFTGGMYSGKGRPVSGPLPAHFGFYGAGQMACVSFHASKTLGIEQGGAILHDDEEADGWLRMARFDGRVEGVTPAEQAKQLYFPMVGWHAYLSPSVAAQGLLKMHSLPRHNDPLPQDDYPDLSTLDIFK